MTVVVQCLNWNSSKDIITDQFHLLVSSIMILNFHIYRLGKQTALDPFMGI